MTPTRPSEPWHTAEALVAFGLGSIGAIGLVVSYLGSSGLAAPRQQYAWLAGSVGSLVVGTVAIGLWLMWGMRSVRQRERELFTQLSSALEPVSAPAPAAASAALVHVRGMERYHGITCPLVADRAIKQASLAQHQRAGRHACGICQPLGIPAVPQ